MAETTTAAEFRIRTGRGFTNFRTRIPLRILIAGLVFVSVLSVAAGTQFWNYRNAYEAEVSMARDKHLVLAKNISLAIDQYVEDVAKVFSNEIDRIELSASRELSPVNGDLLLSFDIFCVALFDPDNLPVGMVMMPGQAPTTILPAGEVERLRWAFEDSGRDVYFSGVRTIDGRKAFHVVYLRPDGLLSVGALDASRVNRMQDSIVFGELGHAAIFDQDGLVIAHPIAKLEENSVDASGVTAVRAMMEGNTGVMQFYSPPMQLDMISGYTVVPTTGWGVMVPQPIRELQARAHAALSQGYVFVALLGLVMCLVAWKIAALLSSDLATLGSYAARVTTGRHAPPPAATGILSSEAETLRATLADMSERVSAASDALSRAATSEAALHREKSRFISAMSHELRTPLNGIAGAIEIARRSQTPADVGEMIDLIDQSSRRLSSFVEDALAYSELGADGSVARQLFDTVPLLRRISGAAHREAVLKGLELRVALPDALMVSSDETTLAYVLGRLIGAAVKRGKNGQSVTLMCDSATGTAGDRMWRLRLWEHEVSAKSLEYWSPGDDTADARGSYLDADDAMSLAAPVVHRAVRSLAGAIRCTRQTDGLMLTEVLLPAV